MPLRHMPVKTLMATNLVATVSRASQMLECMPQPSLRSMVYLSLGPIFCPKFNRAQPKTNDKGDCRRDRVEAEIPKKKRWPTQLMALVKEHELNATRETRSTPARD
ncbi:hypothetical protein CPB85DRAFT_1284941 [Mucidula mucida]|nr:hypothetical protein CPB85DRAFT_1284941 [Mucidula mucida]